MSQNGSLEIWSKPLSGGAVAVGLFNRGTSATTMTVKLSDVGVAKAKTITDLWSGRAVVANGGAVTATVPMHGVVLLRVEP